MSHNQQPVARDAAIVSVVIPVYRNAGSLPTLYEKMVETIAASGVGGYQFIFVNDGSDDGSWDILQDLASKDDNVLSINLSRNFGQHAANNAGFQHATGDIIVNMSADLQDPPEVIGQIVDKIYDGHDIVLAARSRVKESAFKRLTSWAHYRLIRISVKAYPSRGFDFWGVNKKAFKAFMSYNDVVRRNQTDLLSIGFDRTIIEYAKRERVHGKSQYNFIKRLDISISQILATAVWPLRLAAILGILFLVGGVLSAAFIIARYFIADIQPTGWSSLVVIMSLTNGVVMAVLGVIGEYLWRIYYETKQRPIYFVNEIAGSAADDAYQTIARNEAKPLMAPAKR